MALKLRTGRPVRAAGVGPFIWIPAFAGTSGIIEPRKTRTSYSFSLIFMAARQPARISAASAG
jgi:hypothetical protein